jgi:hypothetical protein
VVDGSKHYYSNTAWIDHGSSGGILSDDQGRVLGITTGVFSNGEYAALKYQDFKSSAEGSHFGTKKPLEYFHTVDEIHIASYNVDDYFDVYVDANVNSDTRVSYWVTVKLKDKYRNAKLLMDPFGIRVSINLETEFNYKEVVSYGTANRTEKETEYLTFHFYNKSDLLNGKQEYASSSIYIGYTKEYYGMNISYDIDFSGANGTIIIFDQYM